VEGKTEQLTVGNVPSMTTQSVSSCLRIVSRAQGKLPQMFFLFVCSNPDFKSCRARIDKSVPKLETLTLFFQARKHTFSIDAGTVSVLYVRIICNGLAGAFERAEISVALSFHSQSQSKEKRISSLRANFFGVSSLSSRSR
jgi:hypothetical protein